MLGACITPLPHWPPSSKHTYALPQQWKCTTGKVGSSQRSSKPQSPAVNTFWRMLTQLFGKDRCVALKYDRGARKPARPRFEWLPALAVLGIRVSVCVVRIPLLIASPSEDSWGGYVGSHVVHA